MKLNPETLTIKSWLEREGHSVEIVKHILCSKDINVISYVQKFVYAKFNEQIYPSNLIKSLVFSSLDNVDYYRLGHYFKRLADDYTLVEF